MGDGNLYGPEEYLDTWMTAAGLSAFQIAPTISRSNPKNNLYLHFQLSNKNTEI